MITLFLKDTRLLVLTLVTVVLAGVSSFLILPRMEDPVLTERAAIINTRLLGADADRIESLITDKLIDELREFDEVKEIVSMSRPNISIIAVTLKDTIYDVDEVWARVRDKVSDLRPQLPATAAAPDVDVVKARAFASIVALVWDQPGPPVYSVLRRSARELEEEIRNVPNTESVELFGDPEEEIVVEVEQAELARLGMDVAQLSRQIAASDAKVSAGQLRGVRSDMLLEVGGEFDSLSRIAHIPVRSTELGQTSYLSDIARITKGIAEPPRSLALVNGLPAIMIASAVLPEARIDGWNDNLENNVEAIRADATARIKLQRVFQQNGYVASRMNDLVQNLAISALTVFLVVFLMMGWRSSWIVGLALPLSSCLVFTGLRIAGIPLHQMSLSGLVIALGMLEGTAIIIVDEVQRRLREGESRLDAVKHGVSHMALPLFGSTITTVLSFLPIATMPGPSGEFVGTIGTSVILALCCSLALSFTIIPSLSALFSPTKPGPPTFWNIGFSNKWMSRIYQSTLVWSFKHPWITACWGILISLPGFAVLPLFKVQFFPSADRNQFHIEIELAPEASLEETRQTALRIRDLLLEDKQIQSVNWVLGKSAPSFYYNMIGSVQDSPRYAQALVQSRTTYGNVPLIRRLQKRLNQVITNAQVRVRPLEQGPPFDAPIELRIFGNDRDQLRAYGERVREILQNHPDVIQTKADLTDLQPKLVYDIQEEEARLAGIDLASIAGQLDATLEGRLGGSILEGTEELPVRVRVAKDQRNDLEKINSIDILPHNGGPPIALSSLGSVKLQAEPALITRFDGRRMNEVRGYLQAGVLPSTVLKYVQAELRKKGNAPPEGMTIEVGGEASNAPKRSDS